MISVGCVYNNKKVLNDHLLKSLENQSAVHELILIENIHGQFKSASEALNYAGKKSKGDYLMFVHQDVMLTSDSWLEDVEGILDGLLNLGIAGVAGNSDRNNGVITNIKHGDPPKSAGKIHIKNPVEVQTLDECLVIIPRSIFNKLHFDEEVCDGWHLYTIDYSLTVKMLGFMVYVIPVGIYHRSTGLPVPDEYYSLLEKVRKKHKKNYRRIHITTGEWSTLYSLNMQRSWFFRIRIFKKLIKKLRLF